MSRVFYRVRNFAVTRNFFILMCRVTGKIFDRQLLLTANIDIEIRLTAIGHIANSYENEKIADKSKIMRVSKVICENVFIHWRKLSYVAR